jgi:ADP-ribosylglycohydrolase
VRVTNHNDEAVAWAKCIAVLLDSLFQGKPLVEALDLAQPQAPDQDKVEAARNSSSLDPVGAGDRFGRTCYMHEAGPVIFHILSQATSFVDAIRANIYCGGDSCGRAWVIGPAMAALYGLGDERGIPLSWLTRISDAAAIFEETEALLGIPPSH